MKNQAGFVLLSVFIMMLCLSFMLIEMSRHFMLQMHLNAAQESLLWQRQALHLALWQAKKQRFHGKCILTRKKRDSALWHLIILPQAYPAALHAYYKIQPIKLDKTCFFRLQAKVCANKRCIFAEKTLLILS